MKKIILLIFLLLIVGCTNEGYDFGALKISSAEKTAENFNKFLGNDTKVEANLEDFTNEILNVYELEDDSSESFSVIEKDDGSVYQITVDDITVEYLKDILSEINFPLTDGLIKNINHEQKEVFTTYEGVGIAILKNNKWWSDSEKPIESLTIVTDKDKFEGLADFIKDLNKKQGFDY